MAEIYTFKIVLIGESGVGKTTFAKKARTGQFIEKAVKTLGVEVHPIRLNTNYGDVVFHLWVFNLWVFNLWDTAGDPALVGLAEGYYINADAAICFYDCSFGQSVETGKDFITRIENFCQDIPILCLGNKSDLGIGDLSIENYQNIAISTKDLAKEQLLMIFLYFARRLMQRADLVIC